MKRKCRAKARPYENRPNRDFFHTCSAFPAEPAKRKAIRRLGRFPVKPEAFRTVLVGLWADPVVTRKFHVASRRINNLRELSGEQAAEPREAIADGRRPAFRVFMWLGAQNSNLR